MKTDEITILQSFHQFVAKQLESDATAVMSPEEVLALWHAEQESIAEIREGLADVDAGRTKSLDEFDRDFRKRRGLEGVARLDWAAQSGSSKIC